VSSESNPGPAEVPIQPIVTGQLLLGTDKRNPLFTIYVDEPEERLHVYYGLELLEVVCADPQDPSFKLLVGRLYNAGLSVKALAATFQVDRKTMQRWGQALLSGDSQELFRVLEGRRAARKLTPEIQAYVKTRWAALSAQGTYGISGRLRQEIKGVFKVQLSAEVLRPLIGELKREGAAQQAESSAPVPAPEPEPEPTVEVAREVEATIASQLPQPTAQPLEDQGKVSEKRETPCDCALAPPPAPLPPAASAPALGPGPQTLWCDHAGVLLMAAKLSAIAQVLEGSEPMFKQWLASLLLGALNIEQTKFLNWEDLQLMLGRIVRFTHPQRQQLERLATEAACQALLAFNARQLKADTGSDFYFDPHTKHYPGQQNVLKGWCPAIRFADKVMHSDFVHTAAGEPIYFDTTDNFADVRQRFFALLEPVRRVLGWPKERVMTWVADRAVFGQEGFEKVLADPTWHLITWEKGYTAQSWPPVGGLSGSMMLQRARNHATDLRSYHLEYVDGLWGKDPRLRQIVVQATNPDGRTIQVSILTEDLQRPAQQIIRLMFSRWIQENDFKYLDKHFGINQITSYQALDYEQLRQQVEDRQVCSGQRKALREQRRQGRAKQSRRLLIEEQSNYKEARRQEQITRLRQQQPPSPDQQASPSGEPSAATAEAAQQLAKLQRAQALYLSTQKTRRQQIQDLSRELSQLDDPIAATQKKESRLESLIAQGMVRMDPKKKRLMDVLRITARNCFYAAVAPFKKAYDNYRDDHDYFRQLIQASGVLEVQAEQIVVHLLPRVNYSPRLRRVIQPLLEKLNEAKPRLPDGSNRLLRFRLARKSEVKLSLQPEVLD